MKYFAVLILLSGCVEPVYHASYDYKATGYGPGSEEVYPYQIISDPEYFSDCIEYQMEECYE